MIQRSISIQSDLANCYTIMDATSANSLPPGVSATRIPPWVLPSVPDDQRLRLRPDLLIFAGLASTDTRLPSPKTRATPNLRSLQRGVTIHIIELTFTSHHDNALTDKMQQHTLLVSLLQAAGWTVSKADITHRPNSFPPSFPPLSLYPGPPTSSLGSPKRLAPPLGQPDSYATSSVAPPLVHPYKHLNHCLCPHLSIPHSPSTLLNAPVANAPSAPLHHKSGLPPCSRTPHHL
jgi:hypothetical protein